MGAVHAVFLKYVVVSLATGFYGLHYHESLPQPMPNGQPTVFGFHPMVIVMGYICFTNGAVAALSCLRRGMSILGKNPTTGQIPWWSYALWWGFHIPTTIGTFIHTEMLKLRGVPVASEVADGYWIGGRYGHRLKERQWAGIIDLTCEFPEGCMDRTANYLLLKTWDAVPPTAEQLETAAEFGAKARQSGPVMVHCAHGQGRSTTAMCAVLVRAGLATSWQDAFEMCQARRHAVNLSASMRTALTEWQQRYHKGYPVAKDKPQKLQKNGDKLH